MEVPDFYLEEAKLCQQESVQALRDAAAVSIAVGVGYAVLDGIVSRLPESDLTQAISEKAAEGSALVVMFVGGLGLAGAARLQMKAGIEKFRAKKAAKLELTQEQYYEPI